MKVRRFYRLALFLLMPLGIFFAGFSFLFSDLGTVKPNVPSIKKAMAADLLAIMEWQALRWVTITDPAVSATVTQYPVNQWSATGTTPLVLGADGLYIVSDTDGSGETICINLTITESPVDLTFSEWLWTYQTGEQGTERSGPVCGLVNPGAGLFLGLGGTVEVPNGHVGTHQVGFMFEVTVDGG